MGVVVYVGVGGDVGVGTGGDGDATGMGMGMAMRLGCALPGNREASAVRARRTGAIRGGGQHAAAGPAGRRWRGPTRRLTLCTGKILVRVAIGISLQQRQTLITGHMLTPAHVETR